MYTYALASQYSSKNNSKGILDYQVLPPYNPVCWTGTLPYIINLQETVALLHILFQNKVGKSCLWLLSYPLIQCLNISSRCWTISVDCQVKGSLVCNYLFVQYWEGVLHSWYKVPSLDVFFVCVCVCVSSQLPINFTRKWDTFTYKPSIKYIIFFSVYEEQKLICTSREQFIYKTIYIYRNIIYL